MKLFQRINIIPIRLPRLKSYVIRTYIEISVLKLSTFCLLSWIGDFLIGRTNVYLGYMLDWRLHSVHLILMTSLTFTKISELMSDISCKLAQSVSSWIWKQHKYIRRNSQIVIIKWMHQMVSRNLTREFFLYQTGNVIVNEADTGTLTSLKMNWFQ